MIDLNANTTTLPASLKETGTKSNLHAVGAVLTRVRHNLHQSSQLNLDDQERLDPEAALHLAAIAMAEAEARIERQQRRIDHLESLSVTDELTGLLNRRGFRHHLGKAIAQARRQSTRGLVIIIDLDDFKSVNDAYGHLAGDCMLVAVGKSLSRFVRETDTVARFGGDEFAILMPSADATDGQKRIAALEAHLNGQTIVHNQTKLAIKASIGCQAYEGSETEDALLNAADKTMYATKTTRQRHALQL